MATKLQRSSMSISIFIFMGIFICRRRADQPSFSIKASSVLALVQLIMDFQAQVLVPVNMRILYVLSVGISPEILKSGCGLESGVLGQVGDRKSVVQGESVG